MRKNQPLTDSTAVAAGGLLEAITNRRQNYVTPSCQTFVDEIIVRWHNLDGDWIEKGLRRYGAYELRSENGCKLKLATCEGSGIMISVELVVGYTSKLRRGITELICLTTMLTLCLFAGVAVK